MLHNRIKQLRTENGMTQGELGAKVGVIKQTVSSWENDASAPNYEIISQLCEIFGVSADYLLGISDKTLSNYEKDGKTPKGTFWPSPLNPDDKHNKKYYDPLKVLEALTALPKNFGKHTKVADVIVMLMNNKLASKIVQKPPMKPKKLTEDEEIELEKAKIGWKRDFPT